MNETTEQQVTTEPAPEKAKKVKKAKPPKKDKPTKAAKAKPAKKTKGGKTPEGPAALKKYAPDYVRDKEHKTAGGNASVNCGDEVAKKLAGKDLDDIYKMVAKATETEESELRKKYKHLNLGMQRMNLGNRLRGVLNAK